MGKILSDVTDRLHFFEGIDPVGLAENYGTPLYVYNERILRTRCRDLKRFVTYPKFEVDYSSKANCNLAFLQIVKSEGLKVDAVSMGEIYAQRLAGFEPEDIFFICNNVSEEEMMYAIEEGVLISVDSLAQLEQFGRLNPGGRVAVRVNPGIGAGHHEKVVTAGKKTKFGISTDQLDQVREILERYHLTLAGINQHIGSLYMKGDELLQSMDRLLEIVMEFKDLEFVDLGGGFGIPYHKEDGEERLDLEELGKAIDEKMKEFTARYGKEITLRIEPGRYISAESSVLLGRVHAVKYNGGQKYVGSDIGFSVLIRPAMYDSYHGVEIYRPGDEPSVEKEEVTIVGNICESGDILAKNRLLPKIRQKDVLGVLDAGAYGQSMSSNYNNRLRPAEVLIRENGEVVLIRERDTLEDLVRHQILL
ncbi:MAG: diaminopimelate decarboxylase [Clostridiaceae bacterium]|nr:diaminopimelate decarboxylase [Clostridiaceae bacterium]